MALAEVVPLFESNFRDVPATLRTIADEIENGEWGEVTDATFLLLGDKLEIFGMGKNSDAGTTSLMLQAGLLRLARAVESIGKEA